MGKRQTMLDWYRDDLKAITGLSGERVKIGAIIPGSRGKDQISLIPQSDTPEEIDGDAFKLTLRLAVVVMIRIDPGKAAEQWQQLNDRWEEIEPTLEDLVIGRVHEQAHNVEIEAPGTEWDAFDDGDSIAVVGQIHAIEYERQAGT